MNFGHVSAFGSEFSELAFVRKKEMNQVKYNISRVVLFEI